MAVADLGAKCLVERADGYLISRLHAYPAGRSPAKLTSRPTPPCRRRRGGEPRSCCFATITCAGCHRLLSAHSGGRPAREGHRRRRGNWPSPGAQVAPPAAGPRNRPSPTPPALRRVAAGSAISSATPLTMTGLSASPIRRAHDGPSKGCRQPQPDRRDRLTHPQA
jgi:hypothetical protein